MTLSRNPGNPLRRDPGNPLRSTTGLPGSWGPERRVPLNQVSPKRARESRQRRAVIRAMFPDRPACARPGCTAWADDVHEPLTRARGGSIVDPENMVPLCRPHHDEVTFAPESELGWAYECGLLRHSWDRPEGGAA